MAQLRILFSSFFLLFTFIPNQSFAVLYVVAVNAGVSAQIDVVDGKLAGRLGPIYKCVFDRTGEDYRYIVMPLKRSLYELDKGSVDVTLPLVYEAGRDRYGDFGGDLFFTDYVYLSTRELPPITRHSALTFVMLRNFAGLRVF